MKKKPVLGTHNKMGRPPPKKRKTKNTKRRVLGTHTKGGLQRQGSIRFLDLVVCGTGAFQAQHAVRGALVCQAPQMSRGFSARAREKRFALRPASVCRRGASCASSNPAGLSQEKAQEIARRCLKEGDPEFSAANAPRASCRSPSTLAAPDTTRKQPTLATGMLRPGLVLPAELLEVHSRSCCFDLRVWLLQIFEELPCNGKATTSPFAAAPACHPRAGCSLRLAAALGVPAQRLFGDTLVSLPGIAKYWRLHFGTGPGETKMNYLQCPSLGNSLAVGRNLGPRVGDEHSLSCNLSRVLATAHGVSPIGPVLLLARPHGAGPLPATPESSARSKKHPSKKK